MAKLKLGALVDDKPVKLTVELPAPVHRDLLAYAEVLAAETGQQNRAGKTDRTDADAVHGDGSRISEGAPSKTNPGRLTAMSADKAVMRLLLLTEQVEETKQCRVVISNQPACVVSHQAWLPVLGDLAIDHARVVGAGVRLI